MKVGGVELVFIPAPGMGHLFSAVEMAKLLLHKNRRDDLSISLLIMRSPFDSKVNSYVESLATATDDGPSPSRLKFVLLSAPAMNSDPKRKNPFRSLIDSHRQSVRDWINEFRTSSSGPSFKLGGVVVDMFCVSMMEVADEFGIPSYVYYTSGAAFLGLHLHLQSLRDCCGVDVTEFKDSDPDLKVPTYTKTFPVKLLPGVILEKDGGSDVFLDVGKLIRTAKGIIVNTFFELEEHALETLSKEESELPPLYPVGPVLNLQSDKIGESEEIFGWLDNQPESSVVFLCFGSGGSFPEPQVKEIARALERSGHRFLWALRRPPAKGSFYPGDYSSVEEVLPEGFTERTKSTGKVIGWAPQAAVLAHASVGGFVSHCGWNSTLESVWFGVPMATWPIYAEQQANAFEIVTEIGTGVELKMDYKKPMMGDPDQFPETVDAETIEAGIRKLMDDGPAAAAARKKAKEMKEKSRKALEEGGSSSKFLQAFVDQVFINQ
ncbi:unnamed protein product [Cuscuta campestris]|uniref:Glycosyltransferase n=1 Tax=Cuscuta campestris TaxID=132261 RepID=A0A484LGU5_9ASTE|nr:unnamed protein product [Cuscuta campestris]